MPTRLRKSWVPAAAMVGGVFASSAAWAQQASQSQPVTVPGPGCHYGEVLDASTADDAREQIEAAGFTDVTALKKSCDNFWHGKATFNGRLVNVVLSPAGNVMLESD